MDKLERYREILASLIKEYASWGGDDGDIRSEAVIDRVIDHYGVVRVGWDDKGRRVHYMVNHVDIINGKFWIQYEGTDRAIAEELVRAGVPREDIVLGFQPPDIRKYTDYAVA
jgi:XisI protein